MKDTVTIKLYRNAISCGDYHDLYADDFAAKIKELKSFAEQIGKNLYFTVCNASDCASFDCFAEIAYTGTLSEQEKAEYAAIVKFFAKDAEISDGALKVYDLPVSIFFVKAQIEAF